MGNQRLLVSPAANGLLRLRSIISDDIESLRQWKNANKKSFFFQSEITAEQQGRWYLSFSEREDDFMFVAEERSGESYVPIGCLGFRLLADGADIYNVIRGHASMGGGRMSEAMALMCTYIRSIYGGRIGCKVLCDNPAVNWYLSNGFAIKDRNEGYYDMELPSDKDSGKIIIRRF